MGFDKCVMTGICCCGVMKNSFPALKISLSSAYSSYLNPGNHWPSSCRCCSVAKSCLTLDNPMDCSPPGFSVHGILQARILECIAIPFFRGSSWSRNETGVSCIARGFFTSWATREALCCMCVLSHFSRVQLFVIPLAVAHQASLSMGFSRQERWSGLPFPPPGDLPDLEIKPRSSCVGRRVLYH